MARGLWRYWTENDGADVWWARVEMRPGEWVDIQQSDYEAASHEPRFWDLPLQQDYVEALPEPGWLQMEKAELRIMPKIVVGMIVAGGLMVTLYIVAFKVFGR